MTFRDKTVLITGGASGIGKIMARKVMERGAAQVIIWDINESGLQQLEREFALKAWKVNSLIVDISISENIRTAVQKTLEISASIDVLINNAGVVTGKYFHQHTHEDIEKNMNINALAPMHITLELLPAMMSRNGGAVCTIASSAGLIANPKMSVYAASKWAAVGWSDSLRLEMAQLKKNISVTTIMPFYISTGMFDGVKSSVIPILDPEKASEKIIVAIEKERKLLAMPLPYWFIRLAQGLLPLPLFDWVMRDVFGIYSTMRDFRGRSVNQK